LVFPLFLTYQLGILVSKGANGVDFVTGALVELSRSSRPNYLIAMAIALVVYAAILVLLRHRGSFHPRAFGPVLLESSIYALTMGSVILWVMRSLVPLPGLAVGGGSPVDVLVISAGAGFHEELIFRMVGMGGLSWLLAGITGQKRAWMFALVFSSIAFSVAHHIGPAGEDFTFAAFVYRTLAGMIFALIYQFRGFAPACWTHALYDVYVLSFA
jgi:hypothetical protein